MELADKINLINALIRENPDTTIREYLEDLKEIESIEHQAVRTAIQNLGTQKHRA